MVRATHSLGTAGGMGARALEWLQLVCGQSGLVVTGRACSSFGSVFLHDDLRHYLTPFRIYS
jgi:hypothetical protein